MPVINPLKKIFLQAWGLLKHFYQEFFESDCANRAASLSYTTLLSLVPLVLLSFWILSLFPKLAGTGKILQEFVFRNFVAHSAQIVSAQIDYFLTQTKLLSWTSLVGLAIVSILMIFDMAGAFNSIWKVKVKRHPVLSFSFYSLVLILAPIFFAIFVVMSSYLATLPLLTDISFLEKPFFQILPYLVAFLVFTFFNWVLPNCRVPLKNAALAGLMTTVLFEVGKFFFGLYMSYFPSYRLIYGALATIPIFLLWIYTSWVVVLMGAVICRTLTRGITQQP